jgi:hypothetical protein
LPRQRPAGCAPPDALLSGTALPGEIIVVDQVNAATRL